MHLNRRGATTVAELCIALVIGSIAAALGGGILLAAERHARRDRTADRESQSVRDVAHVLGTELASAHAAAITLRGDTAIDISSHIGASVACVARPTELVLPSSTTTLGAPYTTWRQPAEVSDEVVAWDTTHGGAWVPARIDSIQVRTDGAGCPADGAFRSAADSVARRAVTRLVLAPPLPAGVVRGAPVRIFRPVRWMLYKSADRSWWLGTRRCDVTCAAAQPVAGPLAAPSDSGLVFALSNTGAVTITVRPPRIAGGPLPASARIIAVPRGDWRARP